jgi:hypothetical protein
LLDDLETTNSIIECWTFHAYFIIFKLFTSDDVAFNSDCSGSINIIACYHADNDTSVLNSFDGSGNLGSYGIHNAHDSN